MLTSIAMLFVVSSVGNEVTWEALPDGGLQYTVRVDSSQLMSLKIGDEIVSNVPPKNQDIRRFRLVIGPDTNLSKVEMPSRFQSIVAKPEIPPATGTAKEVAKAATKDATKNSDKGSDSVVGPRFPEGNLVAKETPVEKNSDKSDNKNDKSHETSPDPWQSVVDKKNPLDTEKPHVVGYSPSENEILDQVRPPSGGHFKLYSPSDAASSKPAVAEENLGWLPYALGGGLIASLAGNAFLGWVTIGQRGRYRELTRKLFAGSTSEPA